MGVYSTSTRITKPTTLACKLRKCSRDLPYLAGCSPRAPHCTTHCPQTLVYVVGALVRFLTYFTANGVRKVASVGARPNNFIQEIGPEAGISRNLELWRRL